MKTDYAKLKRQDFQLTVNKHLAHLIFHQMTDLAPAFNYVDSHIELDVSNWGEFTVDELFEVKYGINMELVNCEQRRDWCETKTVNFVARTENDNGVVACVDIVPGKEPQPAGLITCAGGGSVLSTFVQRRNFYSGRDLYLLTPKNKMSIYAKLFCCTVIEANKYRFSYGRQANKTLPSLQLKLPITANGLPDFTYMETYMKSLLYSDRI